MGIDWTRENTKKLITLYKQQQLLWDVNDPEYRSTTKREDAVNAIKDKLQKYLPELTNDDIRYKINMIRSTFFRNELSRRAAALGKGEARGKKPPKWWCYDQLLFLAPNEKKRSGSDSENQISIDHTDNNIESDEMPVAFKCDAIWSRTTIMQLIALFKEKTELWDANEKGYPNAIKREAAFETIRRTMQEFIPKISTKVIRAKITLLKNQFRKEITRMRTETGPKRKPKLWCFDQLRFLLPAVEKNIRYTMFWSEINTLKLIALMQEKRELWDIKETGYPDLKKRHAAYKEIRRAMREVLPTLKISEVRAKVAHIKVQFRRQLKYLEQNAEEKPTYWCFNHLLFLLPCYETTSNSLSQSTIESIASGPTLKRQVKSKRRREESDSPPPQKKRHQSDLGADCRICLKPIESVPVSLTSNAQKFLEGDLKFTYISIIDLRPDLPQNFCYECYNNLVSFKAFYAQCRQANDFLKELLQTFVKEETVNEASENEGDEVNEGGETSNSGQCEDLESSENWNDDNEMVEFLSVESLQENLTGTVEELIVECKFDPDESDKSETQADQTDRDTKELEDSLQFVRDEVDSDIEEESNENGKESVSYSVDHSQVESESEDSPDERQFVCKYCEKSFVKNYKLREHERIHTDIRPFICHVCGKSFRHQTSCRHHLTLHYGKPFECPECDQRFANKSLLATHSRVHRKEYPYRCHFEGCTAAYIKRGQLTDHMFTHSNLRTVECELCPSTFKHRNALTRHMSKVHPTMTYRCPECLWCNAQPCRIRKHLKDSHAIEMKDVTLLKIGLPGPQQRRRGIRKSLGATLE